MITWGEDFGNVILDGDSLMIGYNSLTGGLRPTLKTDLTATGIHYLLVGPYSDATSNYSAVSGKGTVDVIGNVLSGHVSTYRASLIVLGRCFNDIFYYANGATQALDDLDTLLDEIYAVAPYIRCAVYQCMTQNGYTGYDAQNSEQVAYNAQLPARIAEHTAIGRRIRIVGLTNPTRSDLVHPVDGASGYNLMAPPISETMKLLLEDGIL